MSPRRCCPQILVWLVPLALGCGGAQQVPTPPPGAASPAPSAEAADPLANLQSRYPEQHYLTARGQGETPQAARDDASRLLLEQIQSRISAVQVQPEPCGEPGCAQAGQLVTVLVRQPAPFKHAALIHLADPVARPAGGFATLATLRRDEAAPFVEQEVATIREKLEAWRKQMREVLGARQHERVLTLCSEEAGRALTELEQQRLALAVLRSDVRTYTPSDDLRSVLELQLLARGMLSGTPTTVVLAGDGGDAKAAEKLGALVLKHVIDRGLRAQLARQAPQDGGLVITVRPEFQWTEDGFHFLRSGAEIQARFAGATESFVQVLVEGNRTKAGGVKKEHALRDSLARFDTILASELEPRLPDLACRMTPQ